MKKRKLLVTSALPYANGSIHLGHLVEHIQTDIFVRFQRLIGNTCYYMCADDAHGTAIMLSSKKKNQSPEEYIKNIQAEHVKDFRSFNISHDHYYTTHSEENKLLSDFIYLNAKKRDAIKEVEIEQYFCEESGLFLADRFIKGTCPKCEAENQYGDSCEKCYATYQATELGSPISMYSSKAPILKRSVHYFFKLTEFESVIKEWLSTNPVHKSVKNKLNEWFESGLKDWDISRDEPYFGFKIPGTQNKYFYVWLDAPVGYIATTKNWCEAQKKEKFDEIWKSDDFEIHHFIGKDILYFHTLFWPAMLDAGEFSLPKKVHVHGFLTVNGEKMSKSRGTFILASTYEKYLNPEFLRYYYASKLSNTMEDIDLNLDDYTHKINADVLGKVINIGSRLGSIVYKKCNGKLTTCDSQGLNLIKTIRDKASYISELYEALEFNKAMKEIMQCADLANQFIDSNAPWALVKEDPQKAAQVCTSGLNAFRYLLIYLKPVLPSIVEKCEAFLNCESLTWLDLETYLENHLINKYAHVAARLDREEVDQLLTT
jgi:methionyl-tRNA synthetase